MEISQTQLSNFAMLAGLLVLILSKMGVNIFSTEQLTFLIGAIWSVGWTIYNYVQRYKKGDLTLGGVRKNA
jgi:hypothetical protein